MPPKLCPWRASRCESDDNELGREQVSGGRWVPNMPPVRGAGFARQSLHELWCMKRTHIKWVLLWLFSFMSVSSPFRRATSERCNTSLVIFHETVQRCSTYTHHLYHPGMQAAGPYTSPQNTDSSQKVPLICSAGALPAPNAAGRGKNLILQLLNSCVLTPPHTFRFPDR